MKKNVGACVRVTYFPGKCNVSSRRPEHARGMFQAQKSPDLFRDVLNGEMIGVHYRKVV